MDLEAWMQYNRDMDDSPSRSLETDFQDLEPDQADYQTAMQEGDKDMYKDLREQRNEYFAEMNNSNKGADLQYDEDFYAQMAYEKWIPEIERKGVTAHGKFQEMNDSWDEDRMDIIGQNGNDGLHYVREILHTVEEVEEMLEEGRDSLDPKHYNELPEALQHWNVVPVMGWDYYIGNATKYLWRAGKKSSGFMSDHDKEIEDLRKAVVYINKRIDHLKGK